MKTLKKSFTLIELLIVIGILSVLVVTILITLNPSEAQKKTRDTKRMKDIQTIQSIIEQYINDGNPPITCSYTGGQCWSLRAGTTNGGSQPCDSNWIETDLCNYAKTIPTDPSNNVDRTYINGRGGYWPSPTQFRYELRMSGSDYEIRTLLESLSNTNNTKNDGGNDNNWMEIGSKLDLL